MTTGIKPATDEEIAAYRMLVLSEGRHGTNCEHWSCADIIKLIARIDSDRAKIAALQAELKERDGGFYGRLAAKAVGERDALQAFKSYVHERLDTAGVPANPEPLKHAIEGCRIGDRLDWVEGKIAALETTQEELSACLENFVNCGVAFEDERVSYMNIQVGVSDMAEARAVLQRAKQGRRAVEGGMTMKTESNPVKPCGCVGECLHWIVQTQDAPVAAEVKSCYHCGTGGTCWTQCRGMVCCNCKRHLDRKPIQPPAAPIGQETATHYEGGKPVCPICGDTDKHHTKACTPADPAPAAEGGEHCGCLSAYCDVERHCHEYEQHERGDACKTAKPLEEPADYVHLANWTLKNWSRDSERCELAEAVLALAAKVTEQAATLDSSALSLNDATARIQSLTQALTEANARVKELEEFTVLLNVLK